ncbi:MAG: hypothetical protein C4341_09030 [Armatimonadota bacterium]
MESVRSEALAGTAEMAEIDRNRLLAALATAAIFAALLFFSGRAVLGTAAGGELISTNRENPPETP